jgi:hypothetical protein
MCQTQNIFLMEAVTSRAVCPLASIYELISHFVAGGSICMVRSLSPFLLLDMDLTPLLLPYPPCSCKSSWRSPTWIPGRRDWRPIGIHPCPSHLVLRRPRLPTDQFSSPYSISESLVGFKRASATHGWTVSARLISYLSPTDCVRFQVPEGLYKLVR